MPFSDSLAKTKEHIRDWDVCLICSHNYEQAGATSNQQVSTTIEIKSTLNKALIEDYCTRNNVRAESIYQLAWAIAVSAFAGVTSPCSGFVGLSPTSRRLSLFRCKIDSNQHLAGLLKALEVRYLREPAGDGLSTKTTPEDDEMVVVTPAVLTTGLYDSIIVQMLDANSVDPALEVGKWSSYVQIPLAVYIFETASGNSVFSRLATMSKLLSSHRATSLGESFVETANALIENENETLSNINIMGDADRKRVQLWNASAIHMDERCIYEVI
ncbi:uncharacterized protein TrAFT101_000060 [Trichoderma asperellum]|uniref:uncharacterized protein n=1 Tax=Trichoderma asperellum TaxID=101201 RepID=UPI00332754D3|nr:hypothetical protein TrAFT101_000060 [Trichoderma asperellum]